MAEITFRIGDELLTAKPSPACGEHGFSRFHIIAKSWLDSLSGAYDFMKTQKKVCELWGKTYLVSRFDGFLDATSIIRMYDVATSAVEATYQALALKGRISLHQAADLAHKWFDAGSTALYSLAFFLRSAPGLYKKAAVLDVCCDITNIASYGIQIRDSGNRLSKALVATNVPSEIVEAIKNDRRDALINTIGSVVAAAASVLACVAIFTGVAPVGATTAIVISLASAILSIGAHYHKNYWCDYKLEA
ncbi:MAG: hypothetical protein HW387_1322 [Parachlamydiales bacterium]|nr:hypothetical protein [Parachlamydiales bacterium]